MEPCGWLTIHRAVNATRLLTPLEQVKRGDLDAAKRRGWQKHRGRPRSETATAIMYQTLDEPRTKAVLMARDKQLKRLKTVPCRACTTAVSRAKSILAQRPEEKCTRWRRLELGRRWRGAPWMTGVQAPLISRIHLPRCPSRRYLDTRQVKRGGAGHSYLRLFPGGPGGIEAPSRGLGAWAAGFLTQNRTPPCSSWKWAFLVDGDQLGLGGFQGNFGLSCWAGQSQVEGRGQGGMIQRVGEWESGWVAAGGGRHGPSATAAALSLTPYLHCYVPDPPRSLPFRLLLLFDLPPIVSFSR